MPALEIRPARPEDRDAVLTFCAHTWDWGDYIEYVWDGWLEDPEGLLLVATMDGKPVGIARIRMLNLTDAWLEGMRVDPAYRHQGIATALFHAQLEEAMRRGATKAGLITESTNTAAIRLLERAFMQRVGAFAPFKATPIVTLPRNEYGLDTPVLANAADLDEITNFLNVSNIFPTVGGLYYEGFTAYSITQGLLETKVLEQDVYLLRRWGRLDGLAIAEPRVGRRDTQLFIGYIDGTTEAISLLAYALRRKLSGMGLESVHANVPDLMMVRDAFVGAEYEWDGKIFYTYERSLI